MDETSSLCIVTPLAIEAVGPGCSPGLTGQPIADAEAREQQSLSMAWHLNQSFEESALTPDKESLKKLSETKVRHKKLKQKLNLLSEQLLEQGLIKEQKDITSSNKSRLLKLAIELDKAVRMQAVDYLLAESILRDIQKIVEHKREHDIIILRGARIMTILVAFIKRFPSLPRTEAAQSMPSMDLSLRLLRIVLILTSSRELLIMSNQLTAISSLLSCALMREQKKLATSCLYLLNLTLGGPNKFELNEILNASLEYILCSSLLKRLKCYIETCITEDDPGHSEFLLLGFKFYNLILTRCCEKQLGRPIYGAPVMDNLSRAISVYFEAAIQLLVFAVVGLLFERDAEGDEVYSLREEDIPTFKLNTLLYIFKCLNIIFHVNVTFAQRVLECSCIVTRALSFLFSYTKENIKESREVKNLCNEIIIFIGNIANQNQSIQNVVRESGLLASLSDHPMDYHIDPLKNIYLSALCTVVHGSQKNLKEAFSENSVTPLLKFVQKEISSSSEKREEEPCNELGLPKTSQCKTLSRKTSVSSMNSTYSSYSKASMAESFSTQATASGFPSRAIRLDYKFRQEHWEGLLMELRQFDD